MNQKGFSWWGLALASGLSLSAVWPVRAATLFTNEAAFVEALGASERFLNDFSDLVENNQYVHPLRYASNGFAYNFTSEPVFNIVSLIGSVTTEDTNAQIVLSLTSTNIRAVGGWLYLVDTNNAPAAGAMVIELSDGSSNYLAAVASTPPPFFGLISPRPLISELRFRSVTPGRYPVVDQLYVAEGQPTLFIERKPPDAVQVSWPAPSRGYTLESQPLLGSAVWSALTNTPLVMDYFKQVTLPAAGPSAFFRLRKL